MKLSPRQSILILLAVIPLFSSMCLDAQANSTRLERDSEHFTVLYWKSHEYLVPHILKCAESALSTLMPIFNYRPTEKIIISTNDYHDFGAAGTTSVPHNFIRLDIAPFELDYENIPFDDRIQWLLSHELVHVIISDGVYAGDSFSRSLFSKVAPEREQPLSVFFSLLTNFDRFSPDWHQESIAMFMETWLNHGFGRLQGNFDEMFFRSMVYEDRPFPSLNELDAKVAATSYLLQMQYYLYGARFSAHLAYKYGSQAFIDWFKSRPDAGLDWYDEKFRHTFGVSLDSAWWDFAESETQFQKANLAKLATFPYTAVNPLSDKAYGWVTQPMLNSTGERILFGSHNAHSLATIVEIDLRTKKVSEVATLPTPRMVQVAAVTIDPDAGLVFYTTNNNYLHRDLWLLDPATKIKKCLFEDIRLGDLTACSSTRELWGIRHAAGKATLVYSRFPYTGFVPITEFAYDNSLQHLSISPSGRWLAATLHQSSGEQKIIVVDLRKLKQNGELIYEIIADSGSPEHPSWGPDERVLFWNAYVNGVSNIYRCDLSTRQICAISHTPRGLFRPICINTDSLFAFEFSSDGFTPVLIENNQAERLPAIAYLGQQLIAKEPQLAQWAVPTTRPEAEYVHQPSPEKTYRSFAHLRTNALIPVVTSFMDQIALGYYGQFSDPLLVHDLKFELAYSPWPSNRLMPRVHLDVKYEYKKAWTLRYQNNASNFYDLVNSRKRTTMQKKILANNTHYWKYDLPHKIKHVNEVAVYLDAQTINDNMTKLTRPDFIVYQSVLESADLRRSIGSVDNEEGTKWTATLMTFHVNPKQFQHVGGLHLEWERYSTWGWPHNVFMLSLAAGARYTEKHLAQGKFYFGGFGNRFFENEPVEQYRKVFRFPGVQIYNLVTDRFAKISIENKLPPLRFGNAYLGHHCLTHVDATLFSQSLAIERNWRGLWLDVGTQVNLHLKHWFNIESTISFGCAKAWNRYQDSWEWFVSFKPFRS